MQKSTTSVFQSFFNSDGGFMETGRPDHLASAGHGGRDTLQLRFADGRSFNLPVKRLEMTFDDFDWRNVVVTHDGTAMKVRGARTGEIPIDSSALRCLVDPVYDVQAKAAVDALRLTREEMQALAAVSEAPPGWDE
jgi:hypothetical protein